MYPTLAHWLSVLNQFAKLAFIVLHGINFLCMTRQCHKIDLYTQKLIYALPKTN